MNTYGAIIYFASILILGVGVIGSVQTGYSSAPILTALGAIYIIHKHEERTE